MDLRGLGAFLSAIAGYFSAQAGAQAGQLQGLLMGEELAERRKRTKMTEEAHQEEMEIRRLQRRLQEAEERRREELFPYTRRTLATQAEASELNLQNQRLWSLYQQGIAPSQITDPVLRQQYEPFYNYITALNSLNAVMTEDDLQVVLGMLSEDQRRPVEILGRAKLFENQIRRQMMERHMQGLDINLAMGEFQLRTNQINTAINIVLNNINAEGTNWDKRPKEQKIEAVQKWIRQVGLENVVPPDFANMFQNIQSADARQLALMQAQINWQLQANLTLGRHQFAWSRALQQEAWMSNIVAGALQAQQQQGGFGGVWGGGTGVAPIGFGIPQPPTFFETTRDNRGSQLNHNLLNRYVQIPYNVVVPTYVGGQLVQRNLAELQGDVLAIYHKLDRPLANISFEEINTLITFDAGLHLAEAMKNGIPLDWNTALDMAVGRIFPVLQSLDHYTANLNYQRTLNNWRQAWEQRRQQRAGATPPTAPQQGQGQPPQQRQGQPSQQTQGQGQGQPTTLPFAERHAGQRGGR
jgi:hypothetical protein